MENGFGAESTADEVLSGIDLSGKRILITGVSAGIGVECARAMAAHGAKVIGTARDLPKAGRALAPHAALNIEVLECDLASLSSVRACADLVHEHGEMFDVIIANAAVMNCPFGHTEDGFETQFGTNYLGHFVLVNRLVPLVSPGGRIVILSSSAHHAGDVNLADPGFETTEYERFSAYGRSKTACALFAVELHRRLRDADITAISVHPGGIRTELMRYTTGEVLQQLIARFQKVTEESGMPPAPIKSIEQGAATTLWAGFVGAPDQIGGRYCENCQVAEPSETGPRGVRPYAQNPERARQLWALSETMVGERF